MTNGKPFTNRIPDFGVGDDIVCIKDHSQGVIKKYNVFTAKRIMESTCHCKYYVVDIGIRSRSVHSYCPSCDTRNYVTDDIFWFHAGLFRKLDNLVDISELIERTENKSEIAL